MGIQDVLQQNLLPTFAFWDKTGNEETLVLATHGLIKKTGKTPQADLDKAERIRQQYFEQKKK